MREHDARVRQDLPFVFGALAFGLLDMAGNVNEWTTSDYTARYGSSAGPDPSVDRVYKGGSWNENDVKDMRAARRGLMGTHERDDVTGFRCAINQGAQARLPSQCRPCTR